MTRGYVLGPGEGVPGGGDPALKASGPSTGGALTLFESDTDGGAPRHVHSREDECFYVLEGVVTVECGDETFEAGPRSFVLMPRGNPHAWDVVGDRATVLIITVPAGSRSSCGSFTRQRARQGSRWRAATASSSSGSELPGNHCGFRRFRAVGGCTYAP
jgi:mannose-6-phosphate isomerase-like protein (cupin superfamily)